MRISLILFISMVLLSSCNVKEADVLLKNGLIYTVDSEFSVATGMVYDNGRIIETGDWQDLQKKYLAGIEIDLKGKPVYPGFIDPHSHFYGYGTFLGMADLGGAKSFDEVLERLKKHSKMFPGDWLVGRGWDQNDWPEKVFPDNKKLDELFPDKHVVLIRIDGHAVLANAKVLGKAGINGDTKIEGGAVLTTNGIPTGVLLDKGADIIRDMIPELSEEEKQKVILKAQAECFKVGLTSVCDAGIDKELIDLYDRMHHDGELKMRIYAMLNPGEENEKAYMVNGPFVTERLTVRSVKLYADGALGSRGAAMLEPYSDDPENKGIFVVTQQTMDSVCEKAYNAGFQVNTHAIGDAANRMVLQSYSKFLKGKNDRRWRIEHSQTIHPDDLNLFGEFSIIPSVQTTHCTSDMIWAQERLGSRIKNAYIYHSLLKQNGWLPNGTDFPIEDIDPLKTFYSAVFRRNSDGWPEDGFQMEESLTREQALRSITIWAAKAGFEEGLKGSLETGKVADFVILNNDLMTTDEDNIFSTKVLAVFSNGELMIKDKSLEWY
ncbi:MAG: amidohydrolase [Marinilabiliales bacterium]|nr:MAG: amidohydrolase [Marinilabiliales bacterium]